MAKLVHYALDQHNVVGRHKAHGFRETLGIGMHDWEYLRDAVLEALPDHPVTKVRPPRRAEERYAWEVLLPITGLSSRRLLVITAWEIVDGRPELITIRVAPKSRQPERSDG